MATTVYDVVSIFYGVCIKEKVNHVLKALAASGVWGHAPQEIFLIGEFKKPSKPANFIIFN